MHYGKGYRKMGRKGGKKMSSSASKKMGKVQTLFTGRYGNR